MPRPLPCPAWWLALLVVLELAVARALGLDAPRDDGVQLALFGWLVTVGSLIWTGIQTAVTVSVSWLHTAVVTLWAFARQLWHGLRDFGVLLRDGFRGALDLFRAIYERVLRPVWDFLWNIIDETRKLLDRVLRPVFDVLLRLRTELLEFYDRFVRPVLDVISAVRRGLNLLGQLGVRWARKLDAQLGKISDAIDAPFRALLGKLNEVINFVNRIATADGLFQRLALIRSIERDIVYVLNAWHNAQSTPVTDEDWAAARAGDNYPTPAEIAEESFVYMQTGAGPRSALIDEMVLDLDLRLRRA